MASWMRTRAASAATALGLMMASLTPALASEGERVVQRGKASWYGAFHHGRRTASGEIFNQNALTRGAPEPPVRHEAPGDKPPNGSLYRGRGE